MRRDPMGRRCCFCNVPQALEPLRIAEGLTAPGPGAICEDCAQFSVKVFEIARLPEEQRPSTKDGRRMLPLVGRKGEA